MNFPSMLPALALTALARSLLPLGRIGRRAVDGLQQERDRHHRQCHVLIRPVTFGNGRSLPLARGRSYLIHLFRNSRV